MATKQKSCPSCMTISQLINMLAFLPPEPNYAFYEQSLLNRQDLIWLKLRRFNVLGFEKSSEDSIPALYIKDNKRMKNDFTIIFSHGNAEDLAENVEFLTKLSEVTNCHVLAYEYHGYSLSALEEGKTNRPKVESTYLAIEAAWRFLVEDEKISPDKIIIYGRSIGTGPSVYLASRRKVPGTRASPRNVAGVLLQSPIESGLHVAFGKKCATCCMCYNVFPSYKRIKKIKAPVAIMHGMKDDVVHVKNGQNLHRKLRGRQIFEPNWVRNRGHNDIPEKELFNYALKLINFLKELQNSGLENNLTNNKEQVRQQRIERLVKTVDESTKQEKEVVEELIVNVKANKATAPKLIKMEIDEWLLQELRDEKEQNQKTKEVLAVEDEAKQMARAETREKRMKALKAPSSKSE